jgi:uncharacterized membrane protein YuzA (DUF378 family)
VGIFMPGPVRTGTVVVVLFGLMCFCTFGFFATYEPVEETASIFWSPIVWRIIYAVVGIQSLAALLWLWWRKKSAGAAAPPADR